MYCTPYLSPYAHHMCVMYMHLSFYSDTEPAAVTHATCDLRVQATVVASLAKSNLFFSSEIFSKFYCRFSIVIN